MLYRSLESKTKISELKTVSLSNEKFILAYTYNISSKTSLPE